MAQVIEKLVKEGGTLTKGGETMLSILVNKLRPSSQLGLEDKYNREQKYLKALGDPEEYLKERTEKMKNFGDELDDTYFKKINEYKKNGLSIHDAEKAASEQAKSFYRDKMANLEAEYPESFAEKAMKTVGEDNMAMKRVKRTKKLKAKTKGKL